jgi:hypothetical protein
MSYSICNVLNQTGIENILRWIPFDVSEEEVLNRLRNKMIRPTTIPQTLNHLMIEHAVAREALRMGFIHHKSIARPLLGARRADEVTSTDKWMLDYTQTYIDMMKVNFVGGTGGLLSHAPERVQSALILSDGFEVEGITSLFQDSVFMMPHLGVLSTVNRGASMEIFEKDCLVKLGTSIAFRGQARDRREKVADVTISLPDGNVISRELIYGTITKVPFGTAETAQIEITPTRRFDIGAGNGRRLSTEVTGGVVGIILDARGRPLTLPDDVDARQKMLRSWFDAMDAYPQRGND